MEDDALTKRLAQHHIFLPHLARDDLEAFFAARTQALAALIGEAMGKGVVDDQVEPEAAVEGFEASVVGVDDEDIAAAAEASSVEGASPP